MRCTRARRLASLELDEALSARDVLQLREHLAACAACSAFHHDLKRIVGTARALKHERAPDGFPEAVNRRIVDSGIANLRPPKSWSLATHSGRTMRILAAAAACAGLLSMGIHRARTTAEARDEAARTLEAAASQDIALAAFSPLDDVTVVHLAGMSSVEHQASDED